MAEGIEQLRRLMEEKHRRIEEDVRGQIEYKIVQEAMREHRRLKAVYFDRPREFCPHELKFLEDGPKWECCVLAFQVGGATRDNDELSPEKGVWRCFRLSSLDDLDVAEGPWCGDRRDAPECSRQLLRSC